MATRKKSSMNRIMKTWIIWCGRLKDKHLVLDFRLKWWQYIRDSNYLNYKF